MQKINFAHIESTNQLIEVAKYNSTNELERIVELLRDMVPVDWQRRHFKLIHLKGIPAYLELVERSQKYGRQPAKLLAFLVDRELASLTAGG